MRSWAWALGVLAGITALLATTASAELWIPFVSSGSGKTAPVHQPHVARERAEAMDPRRQEKARMERLPPFFLRLECKGRLFLKKGANGKVGAFPGDPCLPAKSYPGQQHTQGICGPRRRCLECDRIRTCEPCNHGHHLIPKHMRSCIKIGKILV